MQKIGNEEIRLMWNSKERFEFGSSMSNFLVAQLRKKYKTDFPAKICGISFVCQILNFVKMRHDCNNFYVFFLACWLIQI